MPIRHALATSAALSAPAIWRAGELDVRLAATAAEIAEAQALRYTIFYEEMGAEPTAAMRAAGRDTDAYDALCDHLVVIDHGGARPRIVGTYRLLRQSVASANWGFYSEGEYDLSPLLESASGRGELLELGRSCVAPDYRNAATISLLWRGIAAYLRQHGISFMFGCASLHGRDPDTHAAALSYLHTNHLAPAALRAAALPHARLDMNRLAAGGFDPVQSLRSLPPLMKGYLRVGAKVGDGAFIDRQFNTIDVFVVMPVDGITRRYLDRYLGGDC